MKREKEHHSVLVRKRAGVLVDIVTALMGFLFLMTVSVTLVLNLRGIYYYDIEALDIPGQSGYSKEIIRENYDILIDYNLLMKDVDMLEFRDFPMSESGRIHFEEVKQIFVLIQYGCLIFGVLFLFFLILRLRKRVYGCLKLTAILSLTIPSVIGVLAVTCWDTLFVLFHKLAFRNDYWQFDPVTDPVILILPDEFFFHCAAAIVTGIVAGSLLMGMLYYFLKRKHQ